MILKRDIAKNLKAYRLKSFLNFLKSNFQDSLRDYVILFLNILSSTGV